MSEKGKIYTISNAKYAISSFFNFEIDVDDLHKKSIQYNKDHSLYYGKILGYYYNELIIFNEEDTLCNKIILQFIKDRNESEKTIKDKRCRNKPFIITINDYNSNVIKNILGYCFFELYSNDIYEYKDNNGDITYLKIVNNYNSDY